MSPRAGAMRRQRGSGETRDAMVAARARPAMLLGPLLLTSLSGCGVSLERTSRVDSLQRDLAASQPEGGTLRQQVAELERTLGQERQAAGDLAALEDRLAQARASLAAAQRGRAAAEAEVRRQRTQLAEEERRLG